MEKTEGERGNVNEREVRSLRKVRKEEHCITLKTNCSGVPSLRPVPKT